MSNNIKSITNIWKEFGSLINTLFLVIGLIAIPVGLGRYYADWNNEIAQIRNNIADVGSRNTDLWLKSDNQFREIINHNKDQDLELRNLSNQIQDLNFRTTANEKAVVDLMALMKEIQQTTHDLRGDMKVVREILQRRDK